jgi:hypothetical protein
VLPIARLSLFAATAATVLVAAGTALGRLESRAWIVGALCGYVTLVGLGLRKPALRMFTDAIARVDHGAALIIDVHEHSAGPLRELFSLCNEQHCTITVALDTDTAIAHADALRDALADGHSLAFRDVRPALRSSKSATRTCTVHRRIEQLEREEARWAARLPELEVPEFWLADGLFTPLLQRIADAFDRTLVVPSHDLRAITDPAALRDKLVDALDHHAIVRVTDSPALRRLLPAVLDSVGRLGVPVRALSRPEHD